MKQFHAKAFLAMAALALALGVSADVAAQGPGALQGRVDLRSGFEPDPSIHAVRAGGDQTARDKDPLCAGFITQAPTFELDYQAGESDLFISLSADSDTTLLVVDPEGAVVCDDDSAGRLNPGVAFESPDSGLYQVWAGSFEASLTGALAVLSFSEIGFAGEDNSVDLSAPALFGDLQLAAGFTPDPRTLTVDAGGTVDANLATQNHIIAEGFCSGFITNAPSVELDFEAGERALFISVDAEADATLAVNAPDGAWWCNDDGPFGRNPLLLIDPAQSGVYDIFVGVFSEQDIGAPAELFLSEIGPQGQPSEVDPELAALFGDHDLAAGFAPQPYQIAVEAGGTIQADRALADASMYCAGFITQAPTVELNWAGPGGPLYISVVYSDGDTTLAIRTPDGAWVCDDDSAQGFNARIALKNADSGVYDIYVGRFTSFGSPITADLIISEATFERY